MKKRMSCISCGHHMDELGILPLRDFEGSCFAGEAHYRFCPECGLARAETGLSDSDIINHYAQTSLYSVLTGVGVGGETPEDEARYSHYLHLLEAHDLTRGQFADIGCSRGGFMRYLRRYAAKAEVTGVECDLRSTARLKEDGYEVLSGDALALPCADAEKDALFYFHVLEHLYDLVQTLSEAWRVLKPNGTLMLEVPDAARYDAPETYVGTMFWFGMKEHVSHFSLCSLERLLSRAGFSIVAVHRSRLPMKAGMAYPSLILIARKAVHEPSGAEISYDKNSHFVDFFTLEVERIRQVAIRIAAESSTGPICFWGIGLEFFALYGHLALTLVDRAVHLVDVNPAKQGLRVDGVTVEAPEGVPARGRLICCSYMSRETIARRAVELGWDRAEIRCLS